ncbi:MAG: histidine phosphotransferase family protein [Pseudomonadota bacterium]
MSHEKSAHDNPEAALDALDLTALIASRICHDVISPVGAINNGLEVLEDESDEDMRKIAMELVKKSARQASAKLQFCRLAFGAAGSAGAEIDTGDAESVARGFVEGDKVRLEWNVPRQLLPKNRVKLLLNLVMIAMNTIPRGGRMTLNMTTEENGPAFLMEAQGLNARIAQPILDLLQGPPEGLVDSHMIQPYYTGLVAKVAGMALDIKTEGDIVRIHAKCV